MVDDDTGVGDLGAFHSDGVSLGESDLLCHLFRASSRYAKSTLLVFGFPYPLAPCVLIGLWVLFAWYAYQLKVLLHRLAKIYVSILGGLGGMLSYFAGYKLQAVEFGFDTSITLLALFVEWLVLMLVILKVYNNGKLKEKTRKGYG